MFPTAATFPDRLGSSPMSARRLGQRGLDRERWRGYISVTFWQVCQTAGRDCKTHDKSYAISICYLGNGVTVAQQTLTLFV